MLAKRQRVSLAYHNPTILIIVTKVVFHHGEGFGGRNHGGFGIGFQENMNVGGVVGLHVVYHQIVRLALTQNLLSYAGIERDVSIVGRAGQAEIWDAAEYEAFESENLTPEKLLASLEAIGL